MNTTQDLSIISLVLNASLLAQAVMALLLLLSLMSWTFIFRKWFAIRRARGQTERFERDFWSGGDLQALYQSAANNRHTIGALERIFESGMREFLNAKTVVVAASPVQPATPEKAAERKVVVPTREQPLVTAKAESEKAKRARGIVSLGLTEPSE